MCHCWWPSYCITLFTKVHTSLQPFIMVCSEASVSWASACRIDDAALSETQLGVFCLVGALATFAVAWMLVWAAPRICLLKSKLPRAIFYYLSMAMLFVDPVYLSVCYSFFGGGDMNGIRLLMPELVARSAFAVLFVLHLLVFFKYLLPRYKASFAEKP